MAKKKFRKLRNTWEKTIEQQLIKLGVPYKYEPYKLSVTVPSRRSNLYCTCGNTSLIEKQTYLPDFIVNKEIIIEAKGRWSTESRHKMKAVNEQCKDYKLYMVFMRDNVLRKGSKTKYTDWCKENNIEYSIGQVDKEWFKHVR